MTISRRPAALAVALCAVVALAAAPAASADRPAGGSAAQRSAARFRKPVIVVDPGHSVAVRGRDPKTGIVTNDYENEPEMRDVWAVALIVRRQLQRAGYRVVLTKNRLREPTTLGTRAHIANRVHADLALSIHDEAGPDGVTFRAGNNIVYTQTVGTYRETPSGRKVYFTDRRVARASHADGKIFRNQRAKAEHTHVRLQGSVGYDLGDRGLPPGNIWIVQLLAHVPWIYNEAGGNSAGRIGLDSADKHVYAAGLVAAVEKCVPVFDPLH